MMIEIVNLYHHLLCNYQDIFLLFLLELKIVLSRKQQDQF